MGFIKGQEVPVDHIVIPQGSTWAASWGFTDNVTGGPADWTDCTAKCQIRENSDASPVITLQDSDGTIIFGAEGALTLRLSHLQTGTLPDDFRGMFDVLLTDAAGEPWRIVQGFAAVSPRGTDFNG